MGKLIDYKAVFNQLLQVKQAADNKDNLLSNQGQALDGYSELVNYRAIINVVEQTLKGESDGKTF